MAEGKPSSLSVPPLPSDHNELAQGFGQLGLDTCPELPHFDPSKPSLNPNAVTFIPSAAWSSSEGTINPLGTQLVWDPFSGTEQSCPSDGKAVSSQTYAQQRLTEDAVQFLCIEFPSYSRDNLLSLLQSNGGDLTVAMEMLIHLELQSEAGRSSRSAVPHGPPAASSFPAPSKSAVELRSADFPSLQSTQSRSQQKQQQQQQAVHPGPTSPSPGAPSSGPWTTQGRGAWGPVASSAGFAEALRKQPPHAPPERPGAAEPRLQRGNSSHPSNSGKGGSGFAGGLVAPQQGKSGKWLDTGQTVALMYGKLRNEASDHARLRNTYFQQSTQAFLVGNKALAKELSTKGRWHNEQMKAAHAKASQAIFTKRNQASGYLSAEGSSGILDLHGLHVGEALPLLRRELAALRNAAHVHGPQQVLVCVGTGHHTKGKTPARLPVAVERLLLDEGVQFSEAQPGLLRIKI